jgi:N-acetyl-anhydromuramyl-L-alanine amidase AmpD
MAELKNGILVDSRVTAKTIANIEHGALDLKQVDSIVIHQTYSPTAESTMEGWKTRVYGAHFLVDTGVATVIKKKTYSGIDGKIYQTAHLDKMCWHVGKVRDKKYPTNSKSIGIEVVAMYDTKQKTYPPPTVAQLFSTAWLVRNLMKVIPSITGVDKVYAHGVISYKDELKTEGVSTLAGVQSLDLMTHLFPFLNSMLD